VGTSEASSESPSKPPALVALGQNYDTKITITARENAGQIVVKDVVPSGAEYVSSSPSAAVSGKDLTWNINTLDRGKSVNITLTLKAAKEGSFASCATVHGLPKWCVVTKIGNPKLEISKSGPTTADLNHGRLISFAGCSAAIIARRIRRCSRSAKGPDGSFQA
jgi:hypothetical protein